MKRLLLVLLLLPSLAWAQKPPINGVAGPTTSAQLQSIITDATGYGPLNFGSPPWTTLEQQNVSPRCVANGVTDCLPAMIAAMAQFTYNLAPGNSGGLIQLNKGTYYFSNSANTTGKHGLQIVGTGINSTVVRSTGNYPIFIDNGTSTGGTGFVRIADMELYCGGKSNANANGIQWNYSYNGAWSDLFAYACNKAFEIGNSYQVSARRIRTDGTGALQNNYGLYMDALDPLNPSPNNALFLNDASFASSAINGVRGINSQGSKFANVEVAGSGQDGWYMCDPPSGTAACQWVHATNVIADTPSQGTADPQYSGFKFVKGTASSMGQMWFTGAFVGNSFGQEGSNAGAVYIDGANGINFDARNIVSVHSGIIVKNTVNSGFSATVAGYNGADNGDHGMLFDASSNNTFLAMGQMQSLTSVSGYLGYSEINASAGNSVFGIGRASCAVGVAFGGGSTGITYGARSCQYEITGTKVEAQFYMPLSSKGSSTGVAALTGLPWPVNGGSFGFGSNNALFGSAGMSSIGGAIVGQTVAGGTTASIITQGTTGFTSLDDTNFTNSSTLEGSLSYFKP